MSYKAGDADETDDRGPSFLLNMAWFLPLTAVVLPVFMVLAWVEDLSGKK